MFDIAHLRKIRKQLDMTQHEFARAAGVSQSMIAKIEAGKLDPTYSHVKKIEETINRITSHAELRAIHVMHKGIISVSKHEPVSHVIKLLTDHDISQLPVIENNHVLGLITESSLLGHNAQRLDSMKAIDIMNESPPIVSDTTLVSAIIPLLRFYPLVLVSSASKLHGVITKSDIVKTLK